MIGHTTHKTNNSSRNRYLLSGEKLGRIIFAVILISPLIAYSLPEDVLSRWPAFDVFADFVAGYIPAIDKLSALSQFPQVTRLLLALLWGIAFPLLMTLILFTKPQENHLRRMKAPEWIVWMTPLMGIAVCWVFIWMPFIDVIRLSDFQCNSTPFEQGICLISTSCIWLGLIGAITVVTVAMCVIGIFLWPKFVWTYYSSK